MFDRKALIICKNTDTEINNNLDFITYKIFSKIYTCYHLHALTFQRKHTRHHIHFENKLLEEENKQKASQV